MLLNRFEILERKLNDMIEIKNKEYNEIQSNLNSIIQNYQRKKFVVDASIESENSQL
jgi:hypothetical protein